MFSKYFYKSNVVELSSERTAQPLGHPLDGRVRCHLAQLTGMVLHAVCSKETVQHLHTQEVGDVSQG
jgi:hypothetical protein